MKSLKNKLALVTWASGWIWEQICYELAKRWADIILVARNQKQLNIVANECEKFWVKTFINVLDLTKNDFQDLEKYEIDILVNNAGFWYAGKFVDMEEKTISDMINLNILALTNLSHIFSKKMKSWSYILNVASTAAFQPWPWMALYFATKAYVLSFTQALTSELKWKIFVSCLCPWMTDTNFDNIANMKFSWPIMSAQYVAKQAIEWMIAKKDIIIPWNINKFWQILIKILPRKLVLRAMEKMDFSK